MIPIPLAGLSGVFDAGTFWQNVATMLGGAAMWAQQRAHQAPRDPYADLQLMVRNPVVWFCKNPVLGIRRKLGRRRTD